jgi:CsoR family transcriptional regulator, copper-sensing transcriptional repressor
MPKVDLEHKSSRSSKRETPTSCHDVDESSFPHPSHQSALSRLRKIRGQIEGIEKMILDRRYCPEILIQFRAVHSALKAVEAPIFEKHLRQCVSDAIKSNNETDIEKKISELIELFIKN